MADEKGNVIMLKHGILGLLNYHEMTGYEVMEVFRDSLCFFWKAQTSQIYRELQGLEKQGWVNKTYVPQKGKPDKNIYSITEDGRKELLKWLSDDMGIRQRVPILMKTFFMGERSREENIRFFRGFAAYCEMFLESLTHVPDSIAMYSAYIGEKEKTLYWEMTVDYGRRNMQMHIEWAEHCIKVLEEEA